MLSKKNRLPRRDFWRVRKTGRKLFSPPWLIYCSSSDFLRVSVVVSKKIAKKAVDRNRLRRLIYTHLRQSYSSFKYSLIVQPQTYDLSLPVLDQILSTLS